MSGRGSIVVKTRSADEAAELARQLSWYAEFGEPFRNKFEGGNAAFVCRGEIRDTPALSGDEIGDIAGRALQSEDATAWQDVGVLLRHADYLARRCGEAEERAERAERAKDDIDRQRQRLCDLYDLLSPDEQMRLIGRQFQRGEVVIHGQADDAQLQALRSAWTEQIAARIEQDAADQATINYNQALQIAALVRRWGTEDG